VARPSKANSQLDFLTAVERGEVVTQMSLSKRIGVAVGLINALLKRSMNKGYVKARQAPYKRYAYYLTPKGFAEKSRLVAEYLESSLGFFRKARQQYTEIFQHAGRQGLKRVALVGSGELLEIALITALAEDVALVGIVDSGSNRDQRFGVRVVQSLAEVAPVDGVVIAEAREPQASYEELTPLLPEERIFAPALLRVTRDRGALILAARRAERQS
jgi:hypothetical protein